MTIQDNPDGEAEQATGHKHQPPHRAVGFWHPHMRKVRAHVIVLWARTGTTDPTTPSQQTLIPSSPDPDGRHHRRLVVVLGRPLQSRAEHGRACRSCGRL